MPEDVDKGFDASWAELDCNETVHRLYHYLDGALTADRRQDIVRHLDECSPCLRAFDFEADLRRLIADRCKDHVPEHLRAQIAAAIDHEHRQVSAAPAPGGQPPAEGRESGSQAHR